MSASPSCIDEQAVEWLVRRDAGPLDATDRERFERWLSDPKHAKAYERAQSLWSDAASLPEKLPIQARQMLDGRSGWMTRGVALAACLTALVLAPQLVLSWRADDRTRVGETRIVALPDGSTLTLNTDSAVAYEFTERSRTVRLLAGEAAFEVVADAKRPFVVEANGGSTRALGTVFVVQVVDDDVRVTDIEHTIQVSYPQSEGSPSTQTLHPGQQVRYSASYGLASVQQAPPAAGAWRRGRLIVENQPLGAVIDELNRYHRGHIQLLGSDLDALEVNGVFPLNDIPASLMALERSLGLTATSWGGYLVFISKQ